MSLLEQTPGLLEALRGEMTPKFLATRSAEGGPNVVPCISLQPAGDRPDTVFFGNFLLRKSIQNLKQDARVGMLVITPELRGWILTGDFLEFQRTGPYVDRQMSGSLLRYNAYTGIRNAGVIRVRSVEGSFALSRWQVARDYALARLGAFGGASRDGDGVQMPLAVRREFEKMVAVKVLAWVGEGGYPAVIPALSLQPAGEKTLVCWNGMPQLPQPPPGAPVATNILTFEAISYQAKGQWTASGHTGAIHVREVYAGGPPLPGGRVA
jgi:pyridoxamine 5'-phosphate oxidase-like protein